MRGNRRFPPWVVLHIPHDSVYIPPSVRRRILLTDEELDRELVRMTDFWTYALFANGVPVSQTVIAPVSRLVVDVERFLDDRQEPMAARGMGVVYTTTSDKTRLRLPCSPSERKHLVDEWYRPHHARLTRLVDQALARYGKALVLDCHSFASKTLPYEENGDGVRPEICIGTDSFHTPGELADSVKESLEQVGFDIAMNSPFAGAITPLKHYRKDKRVGALMLEIRRGMYEDEGTGALARSFCVLSRTLVGALGKGLA